MLLFFVFFAVVAAHSKLYCTKLILNAAGRPVRCEGWPNDNSFYVHIWGPGNTEKTRENPNRADEHLVGDILAGRRPVATGTTPIQSRRAQVSRGETVNVLWSLNNHKFDTFIQWEGRGPLPPNAPEPQYNDWISPTRQIAQSPYRPRGKCEAFTLGQGVLGQIMATQPNAGGGPGFGGLSEMMACWGPVTIPSNMPTGLNRLLYKWHHPPNDARFYDEFWVDVRDGPAPSSGNSLGQARAPTKTDPAFVHPQVFSMSYYMTAYNDLRAGFGGQQQRYLDHWLNFGIVEGRSAHPQFQSTTYLSRYADLANAFGPTNYKAAIRHWVAHGIAEGRRATTTAFENYVPRPTISFSFATKSSTLKFRIWDLDQNMTTGPWTAVLNLTTAVALSSRTPGITVSSSGYSVVVTGSKAPQPTEYLSIQLTEPPNSDYFEESTTFLPSVVAAKINDVPLFCDDEVESEAIIAMIAQELESNKVAPSSNSTDWTFIAVLSTAAVVLAAVGVGYWCNKRKEARTALTDTSRMVEFAAVPTVQPSVP